MRRIGILTSGGDTPGMNAAIHAVVRTAKARGLQTIGVYKGYAGLIEGRLAEIRSKEVEGIVNKGGTILKTARCEAMRTPEGQQQAVKVLKAFGIDGLVVIGGDGSFKGAQTLSHLGVPTIGLPGTIDNDLAYTEYTIGFDTAADCATSEIAKIRDTMLSHERIGVVEVMGRNCGDIALRAGVAGEAEFILVPEMEFDVDAVCENLQHRRIKGNMTSIIVISEGAGKGEALANYIRAKTSFDVKSVVLGYVQRGGIPTAFDRLLATKMGVKAVDLLMSGVSARVVGIYKNRIIDYDIDEALAMPKTFDEELYNAHLLMNSY
ncbi:MAG: 6-phosphofructokinase [Christensenellaceae bacterium]|nr:6-phosphofructokinase [Christensenellaceae bacterium]